MIYNRQLKVVDYIDQFTRSRFEQQTQTTFAMIKPDVVTARHIGAILQAIEAQKFIICRLKMTQFTRRDAESFYAEHKGKPFFENLVTFMTSGPVVGMELQKSAAIHDWRALLGPTNTQTARE